jgi:hypothetical protein
MDRKNALGKLQDLKEAKACIPVKNLEQARLVSSRTHISSLQGAALEA